MLFIMFSFITFYHYLKNNQLITLRWQKCLSIGMNPGAVKFETKPSRDKLSFAEQILSLHRETMPAVPALYLGRQHAKNVLTCVATSLPASCDLSPEASSAALQFVVNLPGFASLSTAQQMHMSGPGLLQVMLARFLARYRPEVNAFLFPGGEFVYPGQLELPSADLTVSLTLHAREMACTGLTEQELGLFCLLVSCCPLDPPPFYATALETLTLSSAAPVISLLMATQELFNACPQTWATIKLKR